MHFIVLTIANRLLVVNYYDYASGDYNGMEGIAVNAMYLAQQSGAIVPYNVLISQRL